MPTTTIVIKFALLLPANWFQNSVSAPNASIFVFIS